MEENKRLDDKNHSVIDEIPDDMELTSSVMVGQKNKENIDNSSNEDIDKIKDEDLNKFHINEFGEIIRKK